MAIQNPKLFGLNVESFLSDILDKNKALRSLGLDPNDLEVIRGSAAAGADRADWVSFSRLSVPIYRKLDQYYYESSGYSDILSTKAGVDAPLRGNLNLNGAISGSAIRYRFISGTGPSATVKIADISTSRLSAWSSFSNPVTDSSPIFYGARVGIATGGYLEFGTPTNANQIRLQTTLTPEVKKFNSEFPTSKILCSIDGKEVVLYAMKGIPLIFEGFFRNVDATIRLTSLISSTPASWEIVEIANPTVGIQTYRNQGGTTSTINYRSASAKARRIQFFYSPNNISQIIINSAAISTLPSSTLPNLTILNVSFNDIKNLPDFSVLTPNLQQIYFIRNPLFQSTKSTERTFNSTVLNRLPTTLRQLHFGSTFNGSISPNIIQARFPNLTTLNLAKNGTPYFYPDSLNPTAPLPNVPNTCDTYDVSNNDFRTIASSSGNSFNIKELTNLISLSLAGNYNLTDATFTISSSNNVISNINTSSTGLPIPSLIGKTSLVSFTSTYSRNAGSLFVGSNFKFSGCNSLVTLNLYASPATGAMPKFTNINLTTVDFYNTRISGGDISGDQTFVIPEKTFEASPNLSFFRLLSPSLLIGRAIHPAAFTYLPKLTYLYYYSYGRTSGTLPNLGNCPLLRTVIFESTAMTGGIPNFAFATNISFIQLTFNQFSGTIPPFRSLPNLVYLYLYNNRFTALGTFTNLARLEYFYVQNNLIAGEIPDFSECPRMFYLVMFNNRFTNYKPGAFSTIYRLKYLDLSRNLLTSQAINNIILDLFTNYSTTPRGAVTVNIRGNALPSGDALDQITFLRSKGWTITF